MDGKLDVFFQRFTNAVVDFYDIPEIIKFLILEIERKRKIFPFWEKKVRFSYASYNKKYTLKEAEGYPPKSPKNILQYFYHDDHLTRNKHILEDNIAKIIPREQEFTSIQYFKKKFHEIFLYFLTEILPFEKKSLTLIHTPINVYKDIFFDFQYKFSESETQAFRSLKEYYKLSEKLENIVEYIFSSLIHTLGIQLAEIIPENFQVELISGMMHLIPQDKIDIVVSIRQREYYLKEFFLQSHIYQFSELFYHIPNALKNKLKMQKDLIYLLALERYFELNPYVIAALARIQKKCIALAHITPLLDIVNFVFSRVEDSIYNTQDILTHVVQKYTNNPEKQDVLLHLFNFCNKNAVLFGTFQSNNRSQLQEQFRLFFLYNLQYFGEGIEYTFGLDTLFLPSVFRDQIIKLESKYPLFHQYFRLFEKFLQVSFGISANTAFKVVFKHIFKANVDDLNEGFFSAFISSLNERLSIEISDYNQRMKNDPLKYSDVVEFIIKTIYHSIKTVFLVDDPLKASKNFADSISRYSPKNVALRSLEIIFFKEIPLSDNNWFNYNLSRNKEKVVDLFQSYINIPKDYFFSNKKLLHISMKQLYSLECKMVLEEWLVEHVIDPFIAFVDKVWKQLVKKGKNLSKQSIYHEINQELSRGIINPQTLENLDIICDKLAEPFSDVFFKNL